MEPVSPFIVFDDVIARTAWHLSDWQYADYLEARELETIDDKLKEGWRQGLNCALFIPYEFGTALMFSEHELKALSAQRQLSAANCRLVIHWFSSKEQLDESALHNTLGSMRQALNPDGQPAGILNLRRNVDYPDYEDHIAVIKKAIAAGDFYQINYTLRMLFDVYGSPPDLYQLLRARQAVSYGALSWLPQSADGSAVWTLSLSPELFIKIDGGLISAEPMKGTLPVDDENQIDELSLMLRNDSKNRAENLMIVDLLRNDLSKISRPNEVKVPELFKVRRFGQVLQMTTPVQARMKSDTTAAQLVQALFPCGSITGAPKKMAMQYIHRLESTDRGLYTGSFGFLEPNASGAFQGVLNVAIRTLVLHKKDDCSYAGQMGAGGGIVHDSTADNEYDEVGWKARFLRVHSSNYEVFETMLLEHGRCELLTAHLQRLGSSLSSLGIDCDLTALKTAFHHKAKSLSQGIWRFKITVSALDGSFRFEHCAFEPDASDSIQKVCIAPNTLPCSAPLRRFKTSWRRYYDETISACGCFDALFFNHDGYLLEGGRSNVFLRQGQHWSTPSLGLDILPGVMRGQILKDPKRWLGTEFVAQKHLRRDDVLSADEVVLSNALRGLIRANVI